MGGLLHGLHVEGSCLRAIKVNVFMQPLGSMILSRWRDIVAALERKHSLGCHLGRAICVTGRHTTKPILQEACTWESFRYVKHSMA